MVDIFEPLSEQEIEHLNGQLPDRRLERGEVFYGPQDPSERLFILQKGKVRIFRMSPDGREFTLAVVEAGTVFGEMALTAQHRHLYEVRSSAPENVEEEVRVFAPHLLVHSEPDGLDPEVLGGVPCWIEVLYSNGMDARISVDGHIEGSQDISTEVLLRVADEAAAGMREP